MPHGHGIEAGAQVDAGRWQDLLPAAASPVEESRKGRHDLDQRLQSCTPSLQVHSGRGVSLVPEAVTAAPCRAAVSSAV
jgi:hypothetical protein